MYVQSTESSMSTRSLSVQGRPDIAVAHTMVQFTLSALYCVACQLWPGRPIHHHRAWARQRDQMKLKRLPVKAGGDCHFFACHLEDAVDRLPYCNPFFSLQVLVRHRTVGEPNRKTVIESMQLRLSFLLKGDLLFYNKRNSRDAKWVLCCLCSRYSQHI